MNPEANTPPQAVQLEVTPDQQGQQIEVVDRNEQLSEGFNMLVDNLQEPEADSFVQEIQDFRDDILKDGGFDNQLYITIKTNKPGVEITVNVSGNTENVRKKLENAIKERSGADVDLGGLTLEELLDYKTIVTVPGAGSMTVEIDKVDLRLRSHDEDIANHSFEDNPQVVSTVNETAETEEQNVLIDPNEPERQTFEVGDTFTVKGYAAEFVITSSGLGVNRGDGVILGVRGNREKLTDAEEAAYSELVSDYMMTASPEEFVMNPIQK